MRQVLFVTATQQARLYTGLQQGYAIRPAAVPDLKMAATILQSSNGNLPDTVVLGHDLSPPNRTVAFVRRAMSASHLRNITWVVLLDRNVAFMRDELAGLARVLVFQETSVETLARAVGAQPTRVRHPLALAVANVKGGTGKTSLIVNLADALARRDLKTVILDVDVADGDVAQALGMPGSAPTIDKLAREIAGGGDTYTTLGRYLYERAPNLHVLPAPGRSDYGQDYLNEMTATAILNTLTAYRYDAILVDLPGNIRATPFTASLAAWPTTRFYLLYTPGYTFGLKGFNGTSQIVRGLGAHHRGRVVILESGDQSWSAAETKEIERTYGLPVAGVLPRDPLVEQSQASGKTMPEFLATQSGFSQMARRFGFDTGGYTAAIEAVADWVIAHDLPAPEGVTN